MGAKVRKLYSRSTSWLSGYSLRRFRGWQIVFMREGG